jgi:phosphoglycolate phosphatase-like HAD superfamily hydrolase
VDYQTAQNAGVDFAFFTQGYRNEPLSYFQNAVPFDDYQEFLGILRRRYSA